MFDTTEIPINILPIDGTAMYYGKILAHGQARAFLEALMTDIEWKNDEAMIFGRRLVTKRKAAWYGDKEFSYTYSNISKTALAWIPALLELKSIVENIASETFNSCLLNLYHNGEEGMAWHSDDEKSLAPNSAIASLSLGAERKFSLKHKRHKQTTSLMLEQGSLLVMKGETQSHWLHSLPKSRRVAEPRINLTFRTMAM